jgi:hypothetical protein
MKEELVMKNKNMRAYMQMQELLLIVSDEVSIIGCKVENKKYDQVIRLHIKVNDELKDPIEFPISKVLTNIKRINDYGYYLNPVQMNELLAVINKRYSVLPMIKDISNLGWQIRNGLVVGYQGETMIDISGSEIIADPYKRLPECEGAVNVELLNQWMGKNIIRQLIFLSQPAGIIAGLLNMVILICVYGKSSTGKTTAAKLSQSCYASEYYEKINLNFHGTENGLLKQLEGMLGMGILIDDTSLSSIKDYTPLVYKLALGTDKARLGSKDFKLLQTEKWATSIMLTSEESILDQCNPDLEGAFARMIEIKVEDDDLFNDAQECDELRKYYQKNYGLLAPEIVKYIFKEGIDVIKDRYEVELCRIRSVAGNDGVLLRQCEMFAVILLTAELITSINGLKFDTHEIKKFLLQTAKSQLEICRALQTSSVIKNEVHEIILNKAREVSRNNEENDRYVFVESMEYRKLIKEASSSFDIPLRILKKELKKQHILLTENGYDYSVNKTINGESKRGFMISTITLKETGRAA